MRNPMLAARHRWTFLAVVALAGMTACADSHEVVRTNPNAGFRLGAGDSFFVSVSRDGAYEKTVYARSGQMTSDVISAALVRNGARVARASEWTEVPAALAAAKAAGATYLVYPTIVAWEDRATEWSGKPDIAEVRIEFFQVSSGKSADVVIIKGKSGLATLGGDHPQDLLPKPIGEFIDSLYK